MGDVIWGNMPQKLLKNGHEFQAKTPKCIHHNISGTIKPTNKRFENRVQTTRSTSWVVCHYPKANRLCVFGGCGMCNVSLFRLMLHVFRVMLHVFLVMLHVFRIMLHVFPATLQETRTTLNETRATLQETPATLHETCATLQETKKHVKHYTKQCDIT